MTSSLSMFTWFYGTIMKIGEGVSNAKQRRKMKIFDYTSAYFMYIVNTITNQGKYLQF